MVLKTGASPSVQMGFANGSANTVRQQTLTSPNGRELTFDDGISSHMNDVLSRISLIIDDDSTHLLDYDQLGLVSSSSRPASNRTNGTHWSIPATIAIGAIFTLASIDLAGKKTPGCKTYRPLTISPASSAATTEPAVASGGRPSRHRQAGDGSAAASR
ncbi:hypothetical protein A6X21_21705 [Planctopirus hydrillae]|uniref:Uncharacterized protein n=1 Tax=Planctopirus hydrillae TaxID=1841610 RepID=A0A1C3EFY3_9PLAN|nr:hypothetical protein A6X21_21705 [Planctopirus hydrillae]